MHNDVVAVMMAILTILFACLHYGLLWYGCENLGPADSLFWKVTRQTMVIILIANGLAVIVSLAVDSGKSWSVHSQGVLVAMIIFTISMMVSTVWASVELKEWLTG